MNNPIEIALTRIKSVIPAEILEYAFQKRELYQEVYPIDQMILDKVIRYRVLKDMNISGGLHKYIPLRREYLEKLERTKDDFRMITGPYGLYRIPPEARENRPITEVISVEYYGSYYGHGPTNFSYPNGINYQGLSWSILESHTLGSSPPKPTVILESGDLVKMIPAAHSHLLWVLNCRLAFDDDLTNLNSSAINPFADLCVIATKAYIQKTVVIPMDKAYIQGGYALGKFGSIIESYSSAEQEYNEALQKLERAMALDPNRLHALLPYIV